MTVDALLKTGSRILSDAAIEEAGLDAWLLLEYVTGITRAQFYGHPETEVLSEQEQMFAEMIKARAQHIPLQHLTHQAFFMGHEFYVDEHVLIPRQDTEILVEEALKRLDITQTYRLLDICTGSGCILISLLSECPDAVGDGVDLSREALLVAERNAAALEVQGRSRWICSDLFSAEEFAPDSSGEVPVYDMIVSNPPYIPTGEIPDLMEEVREHDPQMALDGGTDGLSFYRRITETGTQFLKEGGWLIYEIGAQQGTEVSALLHRHGYEEVQVIKDLAGLDRVVLGRKKRMEESHV